MSKDKRKEISKPLSSLCILLTNSNGLNDQNKVNNLLNYAKAQGPDIMITTETHWKDDEWLTDRKTNRWSINHSKSGNDHASGGVAIWTKKSKLRITNSTISERIVAVDVDYKGHNLRVIAIYAPTGDKAMMLRWWREHLETIEQMLTTGREIFLAGDFNFVTKVEDSTKGKISHKKLSKLLQKLTDKHRLIDLEPNTGGCRYTFEHRNGSGYQARLDRVYTNIQSFSSQNIVMPIKINPKDDHYPFIVRTPKAMYRKEIMEIEYGDSRTGLSSTETTGTFRKSARKPDGR
jgi:exonuclease III